MRLIVMAALAAACTTGGCSTFEDCALGELTGTWRWSYTETDGNCGPIADETVNMSSAESTPSGCAVYSEGVSSDQCRMELDFECPTADNLGSQRWTIVADHVAEGLVAAEGTVQLEHRDGSCRSTYDIDIERI